MDDISSTIITENETNSYVLSMQTMPVEFGLFDVEKITDEMLNMVISAKGYGLAGPQVNLLHSVFVMATGNFKRVIINPMIRTTGTSEKKKEGCLSFPNLWLNIDRPNTVVAKYQNVHADWVEEEFNGIWARCFLHEYDHLDGKVFTELSTRVGLKLARNKQRTLNKKEMRNGKI